MILKDFGITLRLLREDDLEMVLMWRNSNHIRQYAISKDIISLDTHKKWFSGLDNKGDLYFVIKEDNNSVGLIWANKFQKSTCETGMYLYKKDIQNSLFAYKVSLTLNQYLFEIKKLDSIKCKILNENSRSMRFTLSLGYKELKKDNKLTTYALTKIAFGAKFKKISKLLNKSTK